MAELAHSARFIPRWREHDLHIEIRDDIVYLHAGDVEHLAGIAPWSTGETLIDDDWPLEIDGAPFYQLATALERCKSADTALAAEFLTWLDVQLRELLTDTSLDHALRVTGFVGSHTVRQAAKILDRDPGISIGMHSLFAHMHLQGWITRTVDTDPWVITAAARRSGWLTIHEVIVRRRTYPQIYVTPTGLDELRTTLHALHVHAPPDEPAHPTLFD